MNLQPDFVARRAVFFSGRFDGKFKERAIRSVAEEVRKRAPFVPVLIVDTSNAEGIGYAELTEMFLAQMQLMVPFVFDDYGQRTGNPYSTYGEVKYCLEHQEEVQCLPLKLYKTKRWPPVPLDHDGGHRGAAQNEFFFEKDLLYKEFPIHDDSELSACKTAMADCIIDRYLEMHPDLRYQDRRQVQAPEKCPVPDGAGAGVDRVPSMARLLSCWPFMRGLSPRPPAGGSTFAVGDAVLYMSAARGTWVLTRVLGIRDGLYQVEAKPRCLVDEEFLKAVQPTKWAASPQSTKSLEQFRDDGIIEL